jgi:Ni,Fe-hydrogenase maturation factor
MKKGKKTVYATVAFDEGVNYREIADTMTEIGFKMNHSSARNYVLRVMKKFADAIVESWDLDVPEHKLEKVVKSPKFQQAICDILQTIESESCLENGRRKQNET